MKFNIKFVLIFLFFILYTQVSISGGAFSKKLELWNLIKIGNLKNIENYIKNENNDTKEAFLYFACFAKDHQKSLQKQIGLLLLKYNLNINELTDGRTPLFTAVLQLNVKMVQLLIELGANVTTKQGLRTPLMELVSECFKGFKQIMIIKLLLEANANPNEKSDTKLMILMDAIRFPKIIYLLLIYGADPFIKNNQNQDFFDYVKNSNQENYLSNEDFRKILLAVAKAKIYRIKRREKIKNMLLEKRYLISDVANIVVQYEI